MPTSPLLNQPQFEHSYTRLAETFYKDQQPTAVAKPTLIQLNESLAKTLDLDENWLRSEQGLFAMAGNTMPEQARPIATAYSGHQFGHWNPTLGDGRAILLGEILAADGQRYDFQLKGAGITPYSRQGDGRSPLGPALREYIISEAMAAIGIATTRSLAVVSSGERVAREQFLPGGVLTRIAKSHLRIGSFEYASSLNDISLLKQLADYTLERLFPECTQQDNPYLAMLIEMIRRQAELVAQWQAVGFIHGVMNTDNMLLSGETIDYGPCAFLDSYNPDTVFSSIDRQGRYAYKNQPAIAQWNLMVFAQAILPLLGEDQQQAVDDANKALSDYVTVYDHYYTEGMAHKLGFNSSSDSSKQLCTDLLAFMQQHQLDFTLTFTRLTKLVEPENNVSASDVFYQLNDDALDAFNNWIQRWQTTLKQSLTQQGLTQADAATLMKKANPLYIPRNHIVEAALDAAVEDNNFKPFYDLIDCLSKPYQQHPQHDYFSAPPMADQIVRATFCGT